MNLRQIADRLEKISERKWYKKLKRVSFQGLSAVNGAFGDRLAATRLGITMDFYTNGRPLLIDKNSLSEYFKTTNTLPSTKVCVLIHGLTHNETAWDFEDYSNYGTMLAADMQYTPFYIRYNTGLHISDNGQYFAAILEELHANYPVPITEICIIAHSMGGLVTHSACHYAQENGLVWTEKVKQIFLLASPHLGSFLEKFANLTTSVLGEIPNYPTRLVGRAINLRSAGIKDLRFGYLRETDWKDKRADQLLLNHKQPTNRLANAAYYIISGRLTQDEKHWVNQLFGDILVRNSSALARSENPNEFNFPPENHYEFPKTNHFQLTKMAAVYEKIKAWLSEV
jgi:triacylglycerol lipase